MRYFAAHMKKLLFALALFPSLASASNEASLSCQVHFDRMFGQFEQGDERYLKLSLRNSPGPHEASLKIADMASPFEEMSSGLELQKVWISGKHSNMGATWLRDGKEAMFLSLMYFGEDRWAGIVQIQQEIRTANFVYPAHSEIELVCREISFQSND
jgi:hypothetical protein